MLIGSTYGLKYFFFSGEWRHSTPSKRPRPLSIESAGRTYWPPGCLNEKQLVALSPLPADHHGPNRSDQYPCYAQQREQSKQNLALAPSRWCPVVQSSASSDLRPGVLVSRWQVLAMDVAPY